MSVCYLTYVYKIYMPSFNRSTVCVCVWSVGECVLRTYVCYVRMCAHLYAILQQKRCACVCVWSVGECVLRNVCVHIYMPSFIRSAVFVCMKLV